MYFQTSKSFSVGTQNTIARTPGIMRRDSPIISFLIFSLHDDVASRDEEMTFLKPSRGTMTIEQTFKNVFLSNAFHGFFLTVRMGRLECFTSNFWVRIVATTISTTRRVHVHFSK
jgi:hypothetical protein